MFEIFVVIALRDALEFSRSNFPQNAIGRRLRLDVASDIVLEPDLSSWQSNQCCVVGDVKYKKVNVAGIKHPDIYQLLCYTIGANVPEGMLVYAAGESEPRMHV